MMNHYSDMTMFHQHPVLYMSFWAIAIAVMLVLAINLVKK